MRVVLDTNCLLASLSRRSPYFNVWGCLQTGEYVLCVSNEILEEYEEIITQKTNALIASNVIQTIINCPNVELIDPHFHFHLVKADEDDNKIVKNRRYFCIFKKIMCNFADKLHNYYINYEENSIMGHYGYHESWC